MSIHEDGQCICQTLFGLIEIHESQPQMQEKEKEEEVFVAERCKDLEGLDEKREKA